MSPEKKPKASDTNGWAVAAIVTGVAATGAALYFASAIGKVLGYSGATGVIGDTIGGIAGPILNFTGLLIVYFSLKEQFTANRQQLEQLESEIKRESTAEFFGLTLKLIEQLVDEAQRKALAFEKIGQQDLVANYGGKLGATQEEMKEDEIVYKRYARVIASLADSFLLIAKSILSNRLSTEQQAVLQRVLKMKYEPYLLECKESYEACFKSESSQPPMLTAIVQQLDVLDKQHNKIELQQQLIDSYLALRNLRQSLH